MHTHMLRIAAISIQLLMNIFELALPGEAGEMRLCFVQLTILIAPKSLLFGTWRIMKLSEQDKYFPPSHIA